MKHKFDASVRRYQYFTFDLADASLCPKCQAELEREQHTFQVISQMGRYEEMFVMSADGYFCPDCPVVVLKKEQFGRHLEQAYGVFHGKQSGDLAFGVLGIMDLEAIPDALQDLPLDHPDMPDILVPFLVPDDIAKLPKKPKADPKKRKQLKAKLAKYRKKHHKN